MKSKGAAFILVVLLVIGSWYFFVYNASGRIESPSGFGQWGQEVRAEYMDGTYGTISSGESLAVIHNGKEVSALRYILSTNAEGSGVVSINIEAFDVDFTIGTEIYTIEFSESNIVVPAGDWCEMINRQIPIENITGNLPEDNYRLNVIPGGMITYTISGATQNAILPRAVSDFVEITAGLPNTYQLIISADPYGQTSPTPGTYVFDEGVSVQITATPNGGCTFTGWSGSYTGTTNPLTITMTENKNLFAHFVQTTVEYTLTISAGTGGSTTPSPGTHTYTVGTPVVCTGVPSTGYHFLAWSGDYTGTLNPYTMTMSSDKTLTATFELNPPNTYTLSTTVVGTGTITKNPDKATYNSGEVVTLTANAGSGWQFNSWSGSISGNQNPTTITMNGNKAVTATFIQPTYTLTTSVVGTGTVTKDPNKTTYSPGEVVTLTAVPGSEWQFSHWTGDLSGTTNPNSIVMNSNKVVTATFTQINYFFLVSQPNGGEDWERGFSQLIYWATNTTENVKIELSPNSGGSWSEIVANAPGIGYYSWLIPGDQATGSNYRIRVSGTVHTSIFDISDGDFTISGTTLPVEDLSTYTEYEASGDYLTVTPSRITFTDIPRSANSYVYKTFGTNYFGDYEFQFQFMITSSTSSTNSAMFDLWGISDKPHYTYEDKLYLPGLGASGVSLHAIFRESAGTRNINLRDFEPGGSGTNAVILTNTAYNKLYYVTIIKSGTSLTVNIYNDYERTSLAGTGTIVTTNLPYNMFTAGSSRDDPNYPTGILSGYVENFYMVSVTPPPSTPYLNFNTFSLVNTNPQTTYTISDGVSTGSKVTVTNLKTGHNWAHTPSDEYEGYLKYDFGTGYFDNSFQIEFTSTITAMAYPYGWTGCITLTDDPTLVSLWDGYYGHNNDGIPRNGVSIGYWNNDGNDATNIKASGGWYKDSASHFYQSFGTAPWNWGPHYFKLERSGGVLKYYLYTDASRTTLSPLWTANPRTVTYTDGATQTWQYMVVAFGRDGMDGASSFAIQDIKVYS